MGKSVGSTCGADNVVPIFESEDFSSRYQGVGLLP